MCIFRSGLQTALGGRDRPPGRVPLRTDPGGEGVDKGTDPEAPGCAFNPRQSREGAPGSNPRKRQSGYFMWAGALGAGVRRFLRRAGEEGVEVVVLFASVVRPGRNCSRCSATWIRCAVASAACSIRKNFHITLDGSRTPPDQVNRETALAYAAGARAVGRRRMVRFSFAVRCAWWLKKLIPGCIIKRSEYGSSKVCSAAESKV